MESGILLSGAEAFITIIELAWSLLFQMTGYLSNTFVGPASDSAWTFDTHVDR